MFADRQIHNLYAPQSADVQAQTFAVAEEKIDAPSIGECVLKVQFKKFNRLQGDGVQGELIFSYNIRQPGGDTCVAEMRFRFKDEQRFDLVHRYFEPEHRDAGIGTDVLKTAEEWFAVLATKQKSDIFIELSTHQPRVMHWMVTNGYSPKEGHAETYREVVEHPERFETMKERSAPDGEPRERMYRKGRLGYPLYISFEKRIARQTEAVTP